VTVSGRIIGLHKARGNMRQKPASRRNLGDREVTNDEISPIMPLFRIDWTSACGVGSSFNPKDRIRGFTLAPPRHRSSAACVNLSSASISATLYLRSRSETLARSGCWDDFLDDLNGEVRSSSKEMGNPSAQAHAT